MTYMMVPSIDRIPLLTKLCQKKKKLSYINILEGVGLEHVNTLQYSPAHV